MIFAAMYASIYDLRGCFAILLLLVLFGLWFAYEAWKRD